MKAVLFLAVAVGGVGVVQTALPVDREPHHRPVFENASVKVLDVNIPPGEVSLFHEHAVDNVAVRITGGRMRVDRLDADGPPTESAAGSVAFNDGRTPYTHRVGNLGVRPVRIIDVELTAAAVVPDARVADGRPNHAVAIENGHVRVSRLRVGPGETVPPHTHQRGWLDVVVLGADAGDFVWHDAGTLAAARTGEAGAIEIVEVEPK